MLRYRLFSMVDWCYVKRDYEMRLAQEVATIEGNRILNMAVPDICKYLEDKYHVNIPVIRENEITVNREEVQIDVSQDKLYRLRNPSGPFTVLGTAIDLTIPFDGDSEAFKWTPSTCSGNLPLADVMDDKLLLRIEGIDLEQGRVKTEIDCHLANIKNCLNNLRKDSEDLNIGIPRLAHDAVEQRRNKLIADQNLVSALGFPLKEREGHPKTYAAPQVRRKIIPSLPPSSSEPFVPEPTLSDPYYDHILKVIGDMVRVMELSPNAFKTMNEESLRFLLLVPLNGHYEGDATGETFNYEGKTDILVRVEGKNIFIGECKVWRGSKKLSETIDQVLRYSSWRDTKVAIIVFNRKKIFSRVLEAIPPTVKAHANFKRDLGQQSETSFRYVFANRDDPNREMLLTVMAFNVPTNKALTVAVK